MTPNPSTTDYARLFAALPARMLILLPDAPRFTIVTASTAYLEATGTKLDEIVGRGVFEVFPEDSAKSASPANDGPGRLRASLKRVVETQREDRLPLIRYDIVRPDGVEERYWTPLNTPVLGENGRLLYIVHRVEDATSFVQGRKAAAASAEDRESLERRLRLLEAELLTHARQLEDSNRQLGEREAELAAVFNQAPLFQGLIALDGTFLRGNELAFSATGYTPQDQLGQKCWDTGWWSGAPDTRQFMIDAVSRAARGEVTQARADYFTANGERRQGDFSISPVRDADGQVVLVYASGIDSTDAVKTQRALADSEHRYRSLVSNIAGMVYRVQAVPPWAFLYVTDGVERLTGYPASDFLEGGKQWASVMLPEDAERVALELEDQRKAGKQFHVEYRIRRSDGSVRWVEGRVRAAEDEPDVFEGTVFDIDERKRAQEANAENLRRLELFRYVAENSLEFISITDLEQRIQYLNPAGRKALGVAPDADVGQYCIADFMLPEDRPRLETEVLPVILRGESYRGSLEIPNLVTGEREPIDWYVFAIKDPQTGEAFALGTVSPFVAERQARELALQESREHLDNIIRSVPSVLWTARPDGVVDFQSEEGTRSLFGIATEEMLRNGWPAYVHPEDWPGVEKAWGHAVRTGEPYRMEHRMRHADGSYRWFGFRANAFRDESGQILRWYGSGDDIDHVKQAQARAEEATRAKGAFLSTMSHEIRTPLNAVLGFAGLLADGELGTQQRDFVNSIRASGDHLLTVINDILDYSKLESGALVLERVPFRLRDTVEAALDIVASQAAVKNIELIYFIEPGTPPACIADANRVRQVLVNLLGNAVKFTESGEIFLRVSASPLESGEYEFVFAVCDTGIGIPADRLDRLFRDFSQVDDSITRRFGGSGLGLAISKRLIEAHGGCIEVESTVGKGSEFRVRFPAKVAKVPDRAARVDMDHVRGRRVLIVDDNRSNLDILGLQLRSWGMESLAVQDPLEARALLERALSEGKPIDLAVLDHQMPELDGLSLAPQLREAADIPIVLLSSLGTTMEQVRAARVDIAAVLTKPIHRSALLDTLTSVLVPSEEIPEPEPERRSKMPPLRLLLAEDNLVNRKVALLLLKKLEYEQVDIAVDGLEAVAAVQRVPYDVVLMDVEMPNLDGLDATRRIRAEAPASHQPQIVALTANALADDRDACTAAGMDDHVPKPINLSTLAQALREAAGRRGIEVPALPAAREPSAREQAEIRVRKIASQVLAGGGEMGALMRSIDWGQTSLGPVYTWPQSLRTALSILLTQKHPIFLWWGRELIQFYNDAYRPILGTTKHPRAMGQRGRECFSEIWDQLQPLVEAVFERGESTMVERGLLCLNRYGLLEEGYFSYGYSPIRDETGSVAGVFVACSENTGDVIGGRRNELLLLLDDQLAPSAPELRWKQVQARLSQDNHDLPFALIYRLDSSSRTAKLLCATGLEPGSSLAPMEGAGDWPLFDVLESQQARVQPLVDGPVLSPWPEPATQALLQPLGQWGVLVAGLSPRLILDTAYRDFVARLSQRLARMETSGWS